MHLIILMSLVNVLFCLRVNKLNDDNDLVDGHDRLLNIM